MQKSCLRQKCLLKSIIYANLRKTKLYYYKSTQTVEEIRMQLNEHFFLPVLLHMNCACGRPGNTPEETQGSVEHSVKMEIIRKDMKELDRGLF